MKAVGVIVFAVVAFTSFTGIICNPIDTGIEPNCDSYPSMPGMGFLCDKMEKPVCGTDHMTYSNECMLCTQKLKLKKEIKIKYKARCIEDECGKFGNICALIYLPVCGSDAVTYSNKCTFCSAKKRNADLTLVSVGICPEKNY